MVSWEKRISQIQAGSKKDKLSGCVYLFDGGGASLYLTFSFSISFDSHQSVDSKPPFGSSQVSVC